MFKNKKGQTTLATTKKGQTTLEFILLVTAVIAALLVFLGPTGPFRERVNGTVDEVSNGMTDMAERISTSRPLAD